MADDIEQLLAFGRMGLETGYYDQARGYFEQVLALDPSHQEATKGLARANEMLSRREDVQPAQQAKPARQEPARPTYTADPQRTIPEEKTKEWWEPPSQEIKEQSRLDDREDSMESKTDDSLQWLSLQLKHVPIKTWIIVFAKMGVAYMFLMSILAVIAVVSSLVLAKIGISILEVLGDFL